MMVGRRVFLTGATGFIGGRVAALLAAAGNRLVCLVREQSEASALRELGADLVHGDVSDTGILARGMSGADAAIHFAGTYEIGIVDVPAMQRTNVDGTSAFLEAVRSTGVPRSIHISSTAALGPVASGVGDARADWRGPYPSEYHRTKTESHRLAVSAMAGVPGLMVICPAFVYGPGDAGPAGRFVRDLVKGRVPGLLAAPGVYSYVHVDDVAAGVVGVLDRGEAGAIYVMSGEEASVNAFAEHVCRLAGRRPPLLRLPTGLATVFGIALDAVSRLTGATFTISRESIATSARLRWVHDAGRTLRDIGWTPRALSEGLPPTVDWFQRPARG
jgi:nucleoside-diphosphate-sugar epimerase